MYVWYDAVSSLNTFCSSEHLFLKISKLNLPNFGRIWDLMSQIRTKILPTCRKSRLTCRKSRPTGLKSRRSAGGCPVGIEILSKFESRFQAVRSWFASGLDFRQVDIYFTQDGPDFQHVRKMLSRFQARRSQFQAGWSRFQAGRSRFPEVMLSAALKPRAVRDLEPRPKPCLGRPFLKNTF